MNINNTKRILVTGATGNIGKEVVHYLLQSTGSHTIIAGVRDIDKSRKVFKDYPSLSYNKFDFENSTTWQSTLMGIDTIFLLRPPQISDVDKYFKPLIDAIIESGIKEIVFLSVQGADKTSYIPHAKIEKLIEANGINYVFIRPSYFMQNLTTTLAKDLQEGVIRLPAGHALFNWVDVANIGEASAHVIIHSGRYKNKAFDITGKENFSFREVVDKINYLLSVNLKYKSTNLLSFFLHKRKQGVATPMIFVMIMLHFLPRFQGQPIISRDFNNLIIGKEPTTISEFIRKDRTLHELLSKSS